MRVVVSFGLAILVSCTIGMNSVEATPLGMSHPAASSCDYRGGADRDEAQKLFDSMSKKDQATLFEMAAEYSAGGNPFAIPVCLLVCAIKMFDPNCSHNFEGCMRACTFDTPGA